MSRLKVLLIVEACNPEWASVPFVGYQFFTAICSQADVTLVTHERNKPALNRSNPDADIRFVRPGRFESSYYKITERLTSFRGRVIWPLYHVLNYPLYWFFDAQVKRQFSAQVDSGGYDIVHALTPMMPRYPVAISKHCKFTPFILGPVNGGVPFPKAFSARGRREFSQLNFFRNIGRKIIPNYIATYRAAAKVLVGSSFTKSWLESELAINPEKTELMYENTVDQNFLEVGRNKIGQQRPKEILNVVFVGRLVPYKGADLLLRAIQELQKKNIKLSVTIVGDGAERASLEAMIQKFDLQATVTITGWVSQPETLEYYKRADIFAFPSVREFGGAVVMEAMACGLPCVVVDNGGIGEYVDESCGFKIAPLGEQHVADQMATHLEQYYNSRELLASHSQKSWEKAKSFSLNAKSERIVQVYTEQVSKERGYEEPTYNQQGQEQQTYEVPVLKDRVAKEQGQQEQAYKEQA